MGSRALHVLKGALSVSSPKHQIFISTNLHTPPTIQASLQPPDVPRLAQTARISLTPSEVQQFAPKIRQVVHWFGQLQTVDLQSIEPSIRADTEGGNQRNDVCETFENREAMIDAVPVFDEPYIRVPKVLNKE